MSDASVRHRRTPSGEDRWQLRYRIDGLAGSRTFTTERDAAKWHSVFQALGPNAALVILDEAEAGTGVSTLTVGEMVAEYVETATGITEGTRKRYRREAARDILPSLGQLQLMQLDRDRVRRWINVLAAPMTPTEIVLHRTTCRRCRRLATLDTGRSGCRSLLQRLDGLSGKTITNRHGLLSAACSWAEERGAIPLNPCRGVRLPVTMRREPVFLSADQVGQLVAAIEPRYKDLVIVLVGTGLRWGEVTALRVGDIDSTRGDRVLLSVTRAWKDAHKGPMVLGPPKSPRSRRTIPLSAPSPVIEALQRSTTGRRADEWIFRSPRGMVLRNGTFHGRVWGPTMQSLVSAGWPVRPTIHDLRHTAASLMIGAGQDLYAISRILGHEKVSTTVDIYGHLRPGAQEEALGALASALSDAMRRLEIHAAAGQIHAAAGR